MAATMKKAAAEDVHVTFEDQQKINKFARNTSRITELKEEIEVKKKQLQNLEDACEDIMLADDDCLMIPYQIGDVFISHSQEETQEMLEEAKKNLQEEIDALESRVESIQRVLADLKVQLYAKFGRTPAGTTRAEGGAPAPPGARAARTIAGAAAPEHAAGPLGQKAARDGERRAFPPGLRSRRARASRDSSRGDAEAQSGRSRPCNCAALPLHGLD
ncbi:hypothetical protein R6Z07F_012723 [Ovis aries]